MMETIDIFSSQLPRELSQLFSDESLIERSIFVTLRFSCRPNTSRASQIPDDLYLCDTSLRKNYDYFWDSLNYTLFGKKYQRTKTKTDKHQLRHLSVLHEHEFPQHSHIHCIICSPSTMGRDELSKLVKKNWENTYFGKCNSKWFFNVRDIYSSGILRYPFQDQKFYLPQALSAYIGPDIASAGIAF